MGLVVPGTLSAAMVGWVRLGARVIRVTPLLGLLCLLSACSAPTKGGSIDHDTGAVADAKETPRTRYVRRVYEQVEKKWNLYRTRIRDDKALWSLRVEFYVNPQGKVETIHVHNDKETNEDMVRSAVRAIQDAEIPPMPAEVIASLKVKDEGRLKFGCTVYTVLNPEGQKPQRRREDRGMDKTIAAKERPTERVKDPRVIHDKESSPALTLFALREMKDAEKPLM